MAGWEGLQPPVAGWEELRPPMAGWEGSWPPLQVWARLRPPMASWCPAVAGWSVQVGSGAVDVMVGATSREKKIHSGQNRLGPIFFYFESELLETLEMVLFIPLNTFFLSWKRPCF